MTVVSPESKSYRLTPELVEQAAYWHAAMQSGEISAEDKNTFNVWHSIAENAEAYQRMAAMWGQVDSAELAAEPERNSVRQSTMQNSSLQKSILQKVLAEQKGDAGKTKRRVTGALASISLLVIGMIFGLQRMQDENRIADYLLSGRLLSDYSTSVGEQQLITLSDQTHIYLNTFSAINVEYTENQRVIHLLQGEIHLEVAKDSARPLVVMSEQGSARALGTQFIVRDRGSITDVTVTESRVEVCVVNATQCQQLEEGEKTEIGNDRVQRPQPVSTGLIHDWPQQLLIVDNQPLVDVLDELRRYRPGYMRVDRQALSQYIVSGVFPLDDISKSLQVLEGSLPIKVQTYTELLAVVGKK